MKHLNKPRMKLCVKLELSLLPGDVYLESEGWTYRKHRGVGAATEVAHTLLLSEPRRATFSARGIFLVGV